MARAHSLLLDAEWRGADLKELVERALQAYRVDHPDTIEIDGEPVPLTASQSLGLSLILQQVVRMIFGAPPMSYSIPHALRGQVEIGTFIYSFYRVVLLGIVLAQTSR